MRRLLHLLSAVGVMLSCLAPVCAADDLAPLNDEFDDPGTLARWHRLWQDEGSSFDPVERLDLGTSRPGWLTVVPKTSVWYRDWRAELMYQTVTGDFVATTAVHVTGRDGQGAPQSQFSLGGLLVRAPREITPQSWRPGGENYLFLSLGACLQGGQFNWEVKTTVNSDSQPQFRPAGGGDGAIRIARVGPHFLLLRREAGGAWQVHQRYYRPDLPAALQVGLTVYTDWPAAQSVPAWQHNFQGTAAGRPDLIAQFDYVHFARPSVPADLQGQPLSDARRVGDQALLAFLADDTPAPALPAAAAAQPAGQDDIAALSDEFDHAQTAAEWQHVDQVEGWQADQLEHFSIDTRQPGCMVLMPHTSTWYRDYRGVLVFKPVTGDFVATAYLRVTNRQGNGPPRSQFSLTGILVRAPRDVTPQTWRAGGENYVFLSLGAARDAGTYQLEMKTTRNSDSQLQVVSAPGSDARLQIARIGSSLILLSQAPDGAWTVRARFDRPDLPATLQVGLTTYTDWQTASRMQPFEHNRTVIRAGNPDVIGTVDYFHFRRPQVPEELRGRALADPRAVSDQDLLGFLGEAGNR